MASGGTTSRASERAAGAVGVGDQGEQRRGQAADADAEAEGDPGRRARPGRQVVLAELDQHRERYVQRDAGGQRERQRRERARDQQQAAEDGQDQRRAELHGADRADPVRDPAAEQGPGHSPGQEAGQRDARQAAGGVQIADPVQLDERVEPEERHRPERLDPGQRRERAPPVTAGPVGGDGAGGGLATVLSQQDEGDQRGRGQEQRGGGQAERDQGRGGEGGGEEEADAAAGREQAHRGGAVARVLAGSLPGCGVEHRDPESGQQDRAPDRAVTGQQARHAQPEPG